MHGVCSGVPVWLLTWDLEWSCIWSADNHDVIQIVPSFVCHDSISLVQKDHPRLRGHLTPRDAQTVTLPSTSALSLWKSSPEPGMRSEFPLCASWCSASLRTVLTAEICEGGSSSWSLSVFSDVQVKETTLWPWTEHDHSLYSLSITLIRTTWEKHSHLLELSGLRLWSWAVLQAKSSSAFPGHSQTNSREINEPSSDLSCICGLVPYPSYINQSYPAQESQLGFGPN